MAAPGRDRLFQLGSAAAAVDAAQQPEFDEVRRIAGPRDLVVTFGNRPVARPTVAVPATGRDRLFQLGSAAAAVDAAQQAEFDAVRRIAGPRDLVVTFGNRPVARPTVAVPLRRLFELDPAPVRAGDAAQQAEFDAVRLVVGLENLVITIGPSRRRQPVPGFEDHVTRMRGDRTGAASVRWATTLRTAAARPPRRSAGVPRAVRLGAARSFLCRRKRRAIRTAGLGTTPAGAPARLPRDTEQQEGQPAEDLGQSAAAAAKVGGKAGRPCQPRLPARLDDPGAS